MSETSSKVGAFQIGGGATFNIGSDRYPFTIVEVVSVNQIIVQADNYRITNKNGFPEFQTYKYTPNPLACKIVVTRRADGTWRKKGEKKGGTFSFNGRNAYLDPSF